MTDPLAPEAVRRAVRTAHAPAVTDRMQWRDAEGRIVHRPQAPAAGDATPAAVLALLYPTGGALHLPLTRRAGNLTHHGGQISLPGGAVEATDGSPLAAALREAAEELAIDSRALEVWTELERIYVPASNYVVHPFVAFTPERPDFRPDPTEVAEVLEVPLGELLRPATLRRELSGTFWHAYFDFRGNKIWGATALIIDQLLERIRTGL